MKAFLIAAGEGTRLKPLTNKIPKCLIPINGTPLLEIWLKLFEKYNVRETLINLHHLPEFVFNYLKNYQGQVKVTTFYEKNLLGSARTVAENRDFVKGEKAFFIIYADNLTNMNLKKMFEYHLEKGIVLTMGLFRTSTPRECGIAEVNEDGIIVNFIEKPYRPQSNLANAGIYVASQDIFNYIPNKQYVDFGYDVLPNLLSKMAGYIIEEYIIDIGFPENYQKAQSDWKKVGINFLKLMEEVYDE